MVGTLRVLRDVIIPVTGEVKVLSAYRTGEYNSVAGGAKKSKHLVFSAVDLIPLQPVSRSELHSLLLTAWKKDGPRNSMGLGLYSGLRFHIDTGGFRKW